MKPIRNFRRRWLDLLQRVRTHREPTTTIAVVGAGAGGVELLLAMQHRLRAEIRASGRRPEQLHFHLFASSPQILPTHGERVRERFRRELAARGVALQLGAEVGQVSGPLAKAGVFAVRQGPILAENLRRAALGRPLVRYRPQRRWLALITTGERYAVASWGPIGVAGRWVWRWKDAIDRRFMARYRELPARRPT